MKKIIFFLILASLIMGGCDAYREDILGEDPELKINPKTAEPTNRPNGSSISEADNMNAYKSSKEDMEYADSLRRLGYLTPNNPPIEADLIDENGWLKGYYINISNKMISIQIYRILNNEKFCIKNLPYLTNQIQLKELEGEGVLERVDEQTLPRMSYQKYYLPKGKYISWVIQGKKQGGEWLEPRKDVRDDISIEIYNRADNSSSIEDLNAYWKTGIRDYDRLTVYSR